MAADKLQAVIRTIVKRCNFIIPLAAVPDARPGEYFDFAVCVKIRDRKMLSQAVAVLVCQLAVIRPRGDRYHQEFAR